MCSLFIYVRGGEALRNDTGLRPRDTELKHAKYLFPKSRTADIQSRILGTATHHNATIAATFDVSLVLFSFSAI
jgi:hypothetical protein